MPVRPRDIPTLQALTKQLNGVAPLADPSGGAFGQHLKAATPDAPIAAPLLIAQGQTDEVVYPSVNDGYVQQRCAAGQSLVFWKVPGRDHGGVVAPDSPITAPLAAWTQDRLAGTPQPSGCSQSTIG